MAGSPIRGLGWRVAWIRADGSRVSQLVVSFHHAISDAMSLCVFFDALLENLHHSAARLRSIERRRPIVSALHRLIGARWPVVAMARIAYYRYLGRLRTMPYDAEREVPVDERRWRSRFHVLERAEVEALLSRCRIEGVTIGQALSAAMILELAERVREREPSSDFDVVLCTSIDMRRYDTATIDPRQMGLLVTAVHSFFRPTASDTLWTLAHDVARKVRACIERDEHRDMAHLHRLLGPAAGARLVRENHGRPADGALLVSNMGRLAGFEHGPFRARAMFATAAQSAWGCTMLLSLATISGRMCLHLGHPSPFISDATGAEFFAGVIRRVMEHIDVRAHETPRAAAGD
jgi:hypothetical protein